MKKVAIKKIKTIKEKLSFNFKNFFITPIVYVLSLGLIVRLILSFFGTLQLDQGTFIAWSTNLVTGGLSNFYNGWSDYLPGYLYVLWILGKINSLNIIPTVLLYKIPAILSDVLTTYLIYKILNKGKKGLIGASIYLFNPAVFANSTLWGQVDGLVALFSVLTIYLLPQKFFLSAITLAIGTLIKPQVAFLIPLIVVLMIKNKLGMKKILIYGVIGLITSLILFLPFKNEANFINFLINRLSLSANQYPYIAVNSFNFWGIFGQWNKDTLYTQLGGYLMFLLSFAFLSKKLWKNKNITYYLMAFIFAFSFLFFTRMHERHLLPLFAPLTILAAGESLFIIPLAGLSITYLLNLLYSYRWITQDFVVSFEPFPVIFLGLISFGLMVYLMFKPDIIRQATKSIINFFNKGRREVNENLPKLKISSKTSKLILISILLFSFVTRTYKLNLPEKDYFDEIYHAFTARIVLHNDPKAWEWWNPHPEGFAYEWTHPPLSKLIMAMGMKVIGENPVGWRLPQAIFGTLSVFMVYLLSKKVFKDEMIAILSSFIFSLDGLGLVLSRMGMNDIYVLFFTLVSIYFFLDEKDHFSSIAFGLAVATKWSAIWAAPILFILWLRRKKKFKISTFVWFLVLPISVYLATYIPMFLTGHDLGTWWGMQQQMWWYHTGLKATHPYTSSWWSWPLDLRPVYLYTSEEVGGMVSRIYAIGNPIVFWFGFVSVVTSLIYAYFEKNKKLGLIVFSYLIFFVPWAASPRVMFIYHYLPSIPFMCMATAYVLRRTPQLIKYYLIIAFLVFVYFYPHWAGIKIPIPFDNSYYWFNSWR